MRGDLGHVLDIAHDIPGVEQEDGAGEKSDVGQVDAVFESEVAVLVVADRDELVRASGAAPASLGEWEIHGDDDDD